MSSPTFAISTLYRKCFQFFFLHICSLYIPWILKRRFCSCVYDALPCSLPLLLALVHPIVLLLHSCMYIKFGTYIWEKNLFCLSFWVCLDLINIMFFGWIHFLENDISFFTIRGKLYCTHLPYVLVNVLRDTMATKTYRGKQFIVACIQSQRFIPLSACWHTGRNGTG